MTCFFNKSTDTISSLARDASWSRGWLRLVVQSIFFGITVASLVLILRMAMKSSHTPPKRQSRCEVTSCLVQCYNAPYYNKYSMDIFETLKETEAICRVLSLSLRNPHFINASIPAFWFTDIRIPVIKISIIGGNLKYLPSNGFMGPSSGHIEILMFENITIDTWESNSLVGLSNLRELYISSCQINEIEKDALRPVDDVLQSLTVINSGTWIPDNLTGTSHPIHLKTVVLSSNKFSDILNKASFAELTYCEILYLNSCAITAIGDGTFDNLINIHILYLNDNELITIPPALFHGFMDQKDHLSRINLRDNPWMCDCRFNHFKLLSLEGMLLVEPSCFYPANVQGMLFSEFYKLHCTDCPKMEILLEEKTYKKKIMSLKSDDNSEYKICLNRRKPRRISNFKFISPISDYKCNIDVVALSNLTSELKNIESDSSLDITWLQPTFLMQSDKYYLIEIDLLVSQTSGLMWYEASCPNEVYCISTSPDHLKIYNTNTSSWYVFCPWKLPTGSVEIERCIMYDLTKIFETDVLRNVRAYNILFYIAIGLTCLTVGAFLVYIAARLNPGLLKGSKRLLFVKYKEVNALVLPPKVPLRSTETENMSSIDDIFILPSNAIPKNFKRTKSVRSNASNAPSYISVMQPSEEQLMEWRKQYLAESVNSSEKNSHSSINRRKSLPYFKLDDDFHRHIDHKSQQHEDLRTALFNDDRYINY